jgi:hypothetical protein
MTSFHGFARLHTPQDLLAKLEHDLERIRRNPNNIYAAFDFFVTAEHLVDWLLPDIPSGNQSTARKAKRESSELLKITSHLANGAKHFQARAKHHNVVENLGSQHLGLRTFGMRAFSLKTFQMRSLSGTNGLIVKLTDGRIIHVLPLAEDVLSYWKKELDGI